MEDDIGERMAEHGIRLRRHDHLPVRSLVIFIRVGSTNYRWVGYRPSCAWGVGAFRERPLPPAASPG